MFKITLNRCVIISSSN